MGCVSLYDVVQAGMPCKYKKGPVYVDKGISVFIRDMYILWARLNVQKKKIGHFPQTLVLKRYLFHKRVYKRASRRDKSRAKCKL